MSRLGWKIIPLALFLLVSVFLWRGLSSDPQHLPSVQLGKSLPEFSLPELGHPNKRLDSTQLKGQVSLLNVWASWCSACIEEQVFLMQLAREGIIINGLNYKDKPQNAMQWLKKWGNPYRSIASDLQGTTAIDLGVYGAPETFIVDKKGIIRYRHAGILTPAVWQSELKPLISQLEQP